MSENIPLSLYRFRKTLKGTETKVEKPKPKPIRDPITDEILLPYVGMEDDLRTLGLI